MSAAKPCCPPWRDGLVAALLALAVYAVLGQSRFYLIDGETFYQLVARGMWQHPNHVLYLPIAGLAAEVFGWFGIDLFRAMTLASACGAALAVFAAHRAAAWWGAGRGESLALAAAVGATPAVLFFATVIEIHGVAAGFAGLAWWATARAAKAPSWSSAALVGVGTGLAAAVHATGHLLPFAVAALLLGAVPALRRPYQLLRFGIAGGLAHAGVWLGLAWLARGDAEGSVESSTALIADRLDASAWSNVLPTVLEEWIVPFAPLSLALCVAPFVARTRAVAVGLWLALVPHLFVAVVYLGPAIVEHGAYLIGLAFPAAWILWRLGGRIALLVAAAIGAVVGAAMVLDHDRSEAVDLRVEDVVAVATEPPAVVVVDSQDAARSLLREAPQLPVIRADVLVEQVLHLSDVEAVATFDRQFAAVGRVVLTDAALARLRDLDHVLYRHVFANYRLEPVHSGTFSGVEVLRRE